MRWTIHAGPDDAGGLYTSVTRTSGDATATSGMAGPPLSSGQPISVWLGRSPGTPPFALLRAAPEVEHATVILASGTRREMPLSPVIDVFNLRFGASPLPDDDSPASIEIGVDFRETRIIPLRPLPPPR